MELSSRYEAGGQEWFKTREIQLGVAGMWVADEGVVVAWTNLGQSIFPGDTKI